MDLGKISRGISKEDSSYTKTELIPKTSFVRIGDLFGTDHATPPTRKFGQSPALMNLDDWYGPTWQMWSS